MKLSFDVQVISVQFHFTNGLFKESVISSIFELASNAKIIINNELERRGYGGIEVSVLPSGTRVRGFKPGRSRRIFRAKKSSARLPSEGK